MFRLYEAKCKKIFAGIICIVMLLTLMLSVTFLIEEFHHDCSGEDCPVCATIQICENAVRLAGSSEVTFTFALIPLSVMLAVTVIYAPVIVPETLVSRKVRLDH